MFRPGRWLLPHRRLEWASVVLGVVLAVPAYAFVSPLPSLESRLDMPGSVVLDARGGVIERDIVHGARIPVALDDVARVAIDATVAAEDQRFWSHPGFDPLAIARAAGTFRSDPSGASTITQQLARAAYLDDGLPLPLRKAREALLAVSMEARTDKETVLEAYLNTVYYGRGAYGIEAAAQTYFGVSASNLDLAQASFLAGLPRSPAEFDAPGGESAAVARQRYVLGRMSATGAIPRAAADDAAATPLHVVAPAPPSARHVAAYAYEELARVLPEHAGDEGLVIETTLDPGIQRGAERSVRDRLALLTEHHASSAAVVVLDPRDGRLLAMVGSAYFDAPAGQINMALEPRQPGSALKPLLYAAALERGYTPASMLLDVPSTFSSDGGPYAPVNYDLRFRGPVTMRVALASSLNVPAVRTLDALGVEALVEIAQRAGLDTLDATEAYGLALTLGGGGVRLIDLTSAYGAFAQEGLRHEPWVIARVTNHEGRVLYKRSATAPFPVVSSEVAFLVADMLSDADARIPGFGASSVLDTPSDAAVKTGTSSEFRDNWTVGFTRERVVGVWVGNADQSPMVRISGVDGAAPIWRDVLAAAVEGLPRSTFQVPSGVVRSEVCAPTGLLPGGACPAPDLEWFVAETEPQTTEEYYQRTADGALAVDPPAEARAWALDAGWTLVAGSGEAARGVVLVQPAPGAVLFPAPELGEARLVLQASAPPDAERVDFYVDGVLVGSAAGPRPYVDWKLDVGTHEVRLVAHLPNGDTAETTSAYEVRFR